MKKSYLITLNGELQERFEKEASKSIFSYTTIVRIALSEYFKKQDESNERRS